MKVVILAPIGSSPYARLVGHRCLAEPGVEVAGIVVRRILNPHRIRSEFKRDGVRLLRKVWKKLVLGGRDGKADDEVGWVDLVQNEGVERESLASLAKQNDIRFLQIADHNDPEAITLLESVRPDAVAFTGGGIVRPALLAACGQGIFNAHMGILPRYRGMDVVEWPILEDRREHVGVTLHFMARGIDTGPIAKIQRVPIHPGDTIEKLRKRFELVMVDLMLDGIRAVRDGTLNLRHQMEDEGRQYFVMHPRIYSIVRAKLESHGSH